MERTTSIPIVFDKSHLLTIGERLYSTSLDLIRELVANAYDADAALVWIKISPGEITVEDNGSGMHEGALRQYFTIGSPEKRMYNISPQFKRKRIGEFGIGKFSVLTIAGRFIVETQTRQGEFRARLTFDAAEWNRKVEDWGIPCEILPYRHDQKDGTKITLQNLRKSLEPAQVIRHLRERFPIGKEDFRIYVNGNEVTATTIAGKRFPVQFLTPFGEVAGEIILANIPLTQHSISEAGITIQVKHIAITKSLFGFDMSHSIGVNRLRGFVNADFLPITSSRDAVIQDSEEYRVFYARMRELTRGVLRKARELALQKENLHASKVLREALDKIGRAVKKNPEVFQEELGEPPLGNASWDGQHQEEGYVVSKAQIVESEQYSAVANTTLVSSALSSALKAHARRHLSLANRVIIRRLQFRNLGIVCRMERFGPDQPPSFLEQGIIFLNIDHPLYQKQADNTTLLTMFITTLLAKELAIQRYPHDAGEAYAFQTQLLTDAFKDVRKL